ncbi:hypothetical protein [Collimonas sp.]|jgi:hypothetical protein|uniref:hypothetical protein n=1 Tax=Collimonas sp. TaxID=1963772 RepID=UPI002B8194E4|nr:hypothetical protein [Collimonas sp.]HWX03720.1 hypothetical protein [Collimonas sp.]
MSTTAVYNDLTCFLISVFSQITGDPLTIANSLNMLSVKTPSGRGWGYVSVTKARDLIIPRRETFNSLTPVERNYYLALAQVNRVTTHKGNK